jgi:hypothetical protein
VRFADSSAPAAMEFAPDMLVILVPFVLMGLLSLLED